MNNNIIKEVDIQGLTSKKDGLRVLSLFDGMGCGRQALSELGIKVDKYYASEIDKYAIDVALHNHSDIIELGDVTKWREWDIDWGCIDLLIGGSPCQGFSFAGKKLNFEDERSELLLDFIDILNHIKSLNPNVKFLLENVKMKSECEKFINETIGVEGVHINSNLFSAQNRDRIYWTNLQYGELPSGNDSLLQDIVDKDADEDSKLYLTKKYHQGFLRSYKWNPNLLSEKSKPILASYHKQPPHCPYIPIRHRIRRGSEYSAFRRLSPTECEKLQTLPIGYTAEGVNGKKISDSQRYKMIGNGWTVGTIKHLFAELKHS